MQKILPLLLLSVLLQEGLHAQDMKKDTLINEVKLNLVAARFRNASLFYERHIRENWSLQMGAGIKFGGEIPTFIGLGQFIITSSTGGIRGYSISPEVRHYFRQFSTPQGQGLYLGGYARHTRYYGDVDFKYWHEDQYIDLGGAGELKEFGMGLQLGYKVVVKGHWVIDLMFMGPRASFNWLSLDLDSEFAEEVIPHIEEEINKRLEWLGRDPISIPTDAETTTRFYMTNFRYSLGIGYRF